MIAAIDAIPKSKTKPKADYLALVTKFPLRNIKSEAEHAAALAVLEKLVGRTDLRAGEEEYMDALAALVEQFEAAGVGAEEESASPLDMLHALMEHREMKQADLAKILGNTAASFILSGKRPISRAQAGVLADAFRVGRKVFL